MIINEVLGSRNWLIPPINKVSVSNAGPVALGSFYRHLINYIQANSYYVHKELVDSTNQTHTKFSGSSPFLTLLLIIRFR